MRIKTPQLITGKNQKYLFVFLLGFGIMISILLPMLIVNKGYFIYYGDYNSQQIPFYQYVHDAIRGGNVLWDWGTDLGSNFIGSYSFYMLGSPFFWLTIPFPSEAVIYLMPWLLALKVGVASLTSYAFIKRFVKSENAAIVGALLYALSGFQAYNVFFNHFHDVVAFFPLLLIALEERVQNDRRGVFAMAVALCAMTNYFFFTGQITFLIIYFICRCSSKDFNVNFRKFVELAIESVIGVMLSAVLLLPAALAILNNPRVDSQLLGLDMVIYNDKFRIIRIIQSFFMIGDPPARSNLFAAETAKWSSIAGFLPMFSMAGVIAFMKARKNNWSSKLIIMCIVMAFVPYLNTSFYAFNSSYYARWYYMPILIMCMMTAYVLDNKKLSFKTGAPICITMLGIFALCAMLPTNVNNKTVWGAIPKFKDFFWTSLFVSTASVFLLIYLTYYCKRDKKFLKNAVLMTVISTFACTACVVWYGVAEGPIQKNYLNEAINGDKNINIETGDEFFRVDVSATKDNYPMLWGYSSMRTFHSIVPSSIMEFYSSLGITRDVASRAELSRYPLRGLLSVKYYFNHTSASDLNLPGFEFLETQNTFDIYENKFFIPMGFTYDHYITKDQFNAQKDAQRDRLLLKGIYLTDSQIMKYSSILTILPDADLNYLFEQSDYLVDCEERSATSCYYFEESTNGFEAKIQLEKSNLVFFSVPYDKGFSATVNGKSVEIEKVNSGFMAVLCPAGDNEISFNYETDGLKNGFIISIAGVVFLVLFVIVGNKLFPRKRDSVIEFDYDNDEVDESLKLNDSVDKK